MEYALLIYENEAAAKNRSKAEQDKSFQGYMAFSESVRKSGHMKGGQPLESVATATTVRVKDGKTLRTDGPFAETREQLGGFYIVDAKDLDEAVAIAARIPAAQTGCIEVRPIMKLPGM
jgi:hypothetical protein